MLQVSQKLVQFSKLSPWVGAIGLKRANFDTLQRASNNVF